MNTKEYNIRISSLHIQSGLVLCDFVLTRLKNLHHFLNLYENIQFNMIWHRRSMAALVLCWGLAGSHVTPSVMCIDWFHWWYNYAADVVPYSTGFAFVTKWVRNVNLHYLIQCKQTFLKDH